MDTDSVAKGARYHGLEDLKAAELGIQVLHTYPTYPSNKSIGGEFNHAGKNSKSEK